MKCLITGKDQIKVHVALSLGGEVVMASEHKEIAVAISNARNNSLLEGVPKYGVVTVNIPKKHAIGLLKKKLEGSR